MSNIDVAYNYECIEAHNVLRSLHGTPDVIYDEELAITAQRWAEDLASRNVLEHSPDSEEGVGENVAVKYVSTGTIFSGEEASDDWYSEIDDYNFDEENQLACGHFSQVIWRDTNKAGFGIAEASDGHVYVVGQYLPPGNFWNKWLENVPPPFSGSIYRPFQEKIAQNGYLIDADLDGTADVLVGKRTKATTKDGDKTVTTTETYRRPDGTTYDMTKENIEAAEATYAEVENSAKAKKSRSGRNKTYGNDIDGDSCSSKSTSSTSDGKGSSVNRNAYLSYDEKPKFSIEQLRNDLIQAHNSYRQRHSAKGLRESADLNNMAQDWARYLCESRILIPCTYEYNGNNVGQNVMIKLFGADTISGYDIAKEWYKTGNKDFPFGDDDPVRRLRKCAPFSQMVWVESDEVGVGRHIDEDSGYAWIVCLYSPAGNRRQQFAENVILKNKFLR